MNSSFDLEAKADYPTSFTSLGNFQKAIMDAIARHDERLLDYFLENFAVGNNGVTYIGLGHGGECNQHWAQRRSLKKETGEEF